MNIEKTNKTIIKWKNNVHPNTKICQEGDLEFLKFTEIEKTGIVKHGFSTRLGGVSEGDCSTMNLSYTRGDAKEAVDENYRRISDAMGFTVESIVCSDQTHTTNVLCVDTKDCGNGITRPRPYTDVDGLVTNAPNVTLATFYADCVPLYLVDPVQKVIGLSHSGWKGTVGNIGARTVEVMTEKYGSKPEDIITAIGPSICMDCYEVSQDVAGQFMHAYPQEVWKDIMYDKGNGKFQLNLWEACRINFLRAGILPEHISMPEICTCCNPRYLFSHRASKGKRGNLAAFLMLKL